MRILKYGSIGPSVQLLQLGLNRAGYGPLETDGTFGTATMQAVTRFQQANGLQTDGIVGSRTHHALLPWYTGYILHTARSGDTLESIAAMHSASPAAIALANPGVQTPQPGTQLVVPLPFDVVPTDIRYSAALVGYCVRGLAVRYPFIATGEIGRSVMGRPLWSLKLGRGDNRVLYNASHHANEWLTTPVLLKFAEQLAAAYANAGEIFGRSAAEILSYASIYIIPAVNPDGIDLVTGELAQGEYFNYARSIALRYPQFPFPSGWKANIRGVDLNLQYPAGWENAKAIKFAQGVTSPAPADYVGSAPLAAPESRAMYDYTLALDPSLTLSYHSQGRVIYWRFLDYEPANSRAIAELFASVSGYAVEETPYASGFAGYKDWFIQDYDRPGYTIEVGEGVNPLPLGDFPAIYRDNVGILTYGALVT